MTAYQIKLYAHGVLNGQKVWGNPGADASYIDAFYGRQFSVDKQLLLEIKRFGGERYSYYTYSRKGNYQEKSGRFGGYFALTLRINYYYADIQNLYGLLDAAFNKYILGTILEQTKNGYRFLVSQFDSVDEILRSLEDELRNYLMKFSSDSDFVSLENFTTNAQDEPGTVNFLEASSSIVANHVKSKGNLSVSSLYPSPNERQLIKTMEAGVKAANDDAQQRITEAQKQAADKVEEVRKETEKLRETYKNADATITNLTSQLNSVKQQNKNLSGELEKKKSELTEANLYKSKYETAKSELKNTNEILQAVKNVLNNLNDVFDAKYPSQKRNVKENSNATAVNIYTKYYRHIVLLLLISILAITIFRGRNYEVDSENAGELKQKTEEIAQLKQQLSDKCAESNNLKGVIENLKNELRIDVAEISDTKPMTTSGSYTVSITLKDNTKLQTEDFTINERNKYIPNKTGSCTLKYTVNGMEICSRTFNVKESKK